jgi:hypothetical protein
VVTAIAVAVVACEDVLRLLCLSRVYDARDSIHVLEVRIAERLRV